MEYQELQERRETALVTEAKALRSAIEEHEAELARLRLERGRLCIELREMEFSVAFVLQIMGISNGVLYRDMQIYRDHTLTSVKQSTIPPEVLQQMLKDYQESIKEPSDFQEQLDQYNAEQAAQALESGQAETSD